MKPVLFPTLLLEDNHPAHQGTWSTWLHHGKRKSSHVPRQIRGATGAGGDRPSRGGGAAADGRARPCTGGGGAATASGGLPACGGAAAVPGRDARLGGDHPPPPGNA